MSELARNEYGEELTAFAVKDEYLRNEVRFRWFVCAYCDTPVNPAATYGDDFKTAPYFTLADHSRRHAKDCPYGESTFAKYGITRKTSAKHEFEVDLPERLVPIRSANTELSKTNAQPTELASPEKIRRRVRAGDKLASTANQYTTGILETLVDARNSAIRAIFDLPSVKAIEDEKQRWLEVNKRLKQCPLDLYGRKLNYKSAFQKANRTPWEGEFIYNGTAKVEVYSDGFRLIATDSIPVEGSLGRKPVNIQVLCDVATPVNRMEGRTTARLSEAVKTSRTVRWYAYGKLELNESGSVYCITVKQPPHIYVYISTKWPIFLASSEQIPRISSGTCAMAKSEL